MHMENLWSIVKSFNKFYYATKIVSDKCYIKWIKKMISNFEQLNTLTVKMSKWILVIIFRLFLPISAIDCT